MSDEIWKPIPDFPGYEVSNMGRVRSLKRKYSHIRKTHINPNGYLQVVLWDRGPRTKMVHQLVMLAFVGPCPDGMEVCHNDSGRYNNHLDNLRYDTKISNYLDTIKHRNEQRQPVIGEAFPRKLRALRAWLDISQRELAKLANISHMSIAAYESNKYSPKLSTVLYLDQTIREKATKLNIQLPFTLVEKEVS